MQFNGEQLEFGGAGRLHRYDTAIPAREAFARFLDGDDLANEEGWRDVTAEQEEAAARSRRSWLYVLVVIAVVAGLAAWFVHAMNDAP